MQEEQTYDDHGALDEDMLARKNKDGVIMIPEENIVSDEEEFAEIEDGEHDDEDHVPEVGIEERLVAMTPIG